MIHYSSFELPNGLKVFHIEDKTNPIAVMNILYNVGSKDEDEQKTGFAHLFEHLMFGGSANIPDYDTVLQRVGGENNAFTSPDITNYYITLPANNIETAFWLESDRMLELAFSEKSLEVQRNVVIEEFKQRYLNQPYGDVWLKLRPLAYKVHPYKWATIGKEISHIENATMQDVKDFFYTHYAPNNAIMVIGGNVSVEKVKELSEKWFGLIPKRNVKTRNLPKEPKQTERRFLEIKAKVPQNAIYMAFHVAEKLHPDYVATDLLSDMLGRGDASRLHTELVKNKKIFSNINAYVTGSLDEGLLVIDGKINDNFSHQDAENAIWEVINSFTEKGISETELLKVKNQAETTLVFSEMELLNRCMNLAYAELLGDATLVNKESEKIQNVDIAQLLRLSKEILNQNNVNVIYYRKEG
jgi:zinc protease